jgi:hypothetical protein
MVTTTGMQGNLGKGGGEADKARAKKIVFCRARGLLIIISLQEPEDAPLSKGVAAQEQACNSTSMKFKSICRIAIRF